MSRSWDGKKGRDKDQNQSTIRKLAYENKSLKREVARKQKMLDRINAGWCPGCLKDFEKGEHEGAPTPEQVTIPVEPPKKERKCFTCSEGDLELLMYYKVGEAYYFRKCNNPNCKNRTKGKKWTPEVKD